MNFLGLIPARGGSKGIPHKNLAELGGKPLIAHTLRAATQAHNLGVVAVTSENPAILKEARRWPVELVRRPGNLAGDRASMIDVVLHALHELSRRGIHPEAVVLLQPTSPLRSARQIDEAIRLFVKSKRRSLISVHKASEHPYESVRRHNGKLAPAAKPARRVFRRQDYPEYFYINGAIYITRTEMLVKKHRFWDKNAVLYVMPPLSGMDIDEPHQLTLARALLKYPKLRI